MNCIKCYQEIPEGSKFCPHCGAEQPDTASAGNTAAQPDAAASQNTAAQPDAAASQNTAAQPDTAAQQDQNTQYQDPYAQYQNTYTSDYQNTQYQTPPVYQSSYEPEKPVNWVPYLVLSIISTICCCPPFGIVAIVYAVKISSEASAGDGQKAADSARKAKIWIIVAVASGIVWDLLMISLGLFSAMGGYYFY